MTTSDVSKKNEQCAKTFDVWIRIKSAVRIFKIALKPQRLVSFKMELVGQDDFNKFTDIHFHLHSCWVLRQFYDAAG